MNKIRVFLADDHLIIRDGLKKLLEFESDIEVVGEAGDGEECISKVSELKPDVLLLDICMPKLSGIEVLMELQNKSINTKILVVTVHDEFSYLKKAIYNGAAGYILKDSDFDQFLFAIHQVYSDKLFIDKKLLPLYNDFMTSDSDENVKFTKREREILKLIASGCSNKEIAAELFLGEGTVRNYISNLLDKLGLRDRTQLAVYYYTEVKR